MPRKKTTPTESIASAAESAGASSAKPRKESLKSASAASGTRRRNPSTTSASQSVESVAAAERSAPGVLESAVSENEQIALRAYSYWEARGCQGGSPEDDWFRAEREVRALREQIDRLQ